MHLHIFRRRPQIEQVHFIGKAVQRVYISLELLPLVWEGFAQGVYKTGASPGNLVSPPVLGEVDAVHIVRVRILQPHLVPDAQVLADAPDIPVLLHTADDVHPGVEQFPEPAETLKATADDGVLFQHGDFQPLLGEDGTGEKAAQATANDDYTLTHAMVWSTLSAISVYLSL